MKPFTQKWTIVSLLEPSEIVYQFSSENWPRHITLLDTFSFEGTLQELVEVLHSVAINQTNISLLASDKALFGESEHYIKVQLFRHSTELTMLHMKLMAALDFLKPVFNNPEFTGDGFIAHETIHKEHHQTANQNVVLNNLALIDMFPANDGYQRNIVALFPFSSKA